MFLGGLWEKLHIEMDVEKMAEYKTAGDFLAGKEMTTAHREMANSLLDDVNDFYLGTIALARALPVEAVRELVEQQGPSGAESLYDAKLIDGAKFLDDVRLELGADQRSLVDESTYARVPRHDWGSSEDRSSPSYSPPAPSRPGKATGVVWALSPAPIRYTVHSTRPAAILRCKPSCCGSTAQEVLRWRRTSCGVLFKKHGSANLSLRRSPMSPRPVVITSPAAALVWSHNQTP
jgi:hypothetical protein